MSRRSVLFASGAACLALSGVAWAQSGTQATLRMSWGSCEPQHADVVFAAATPYKLVVSAADFTPGPLADDHVFTDMLLAIAPLGGGDYPEAWRFDELGCQTTAQVTLSSAALDPACPALVGLNPLAITYIYPLDEPTNRILVRLAIAYDTVSPAPDTRYAIWQLSFDMTAAVVGPGTPGTSCGGAEQAMQIWCEWTQLGTVRGVAVPFQTAPGDADHVTWNGDPALPTVPATWSHVKALYR